MEAVLESRVHAIMPGAMLVTEAVMDIMHAMKPRAMLVTEAVMEMVKLVTEQRPLQDFF